ncbi:MAG TPA: YigZ family protein [Holophaga sp.]|nr:YigZ family protein [Holophaga sp.]
MLRPTVPCVFRFREKASIFLTELHPAQDGEARAEILARIRKRDHDATHHCSAWRQGAPILAQGQDDDGEPSGTAGAPMLKVLEGEGLTDVLAVCIRWFGGTKLGSGGLVRAYTEGVQGAIQEARMQGALEGIRILHSGSITVPSEIAHLPFALLGAFPEAEITGQEFTGSCATLRFRIPPGREAEMDHAWRERSRGGTIVWE